MQTNTSAEETPVASKPWVEPTLWPKPKISQFGPRATYETSGAKTGTILLGTLTILTAYGSFFLYQAEAKRHDGLLNHAQFVSAEVTDIRRDEDSRSARLTYTVGGETFSKRKSISRDLARSYPEGSKIPIVVSGTDPTVFRLISFTRSDAERELRRDIVLGSIFTLLFGLGTLGIRWSVRNSRRILSDWPATAALATSIKTTTGDEGSKSHHVEYQFRVNGETITGTTVSAQPIAVGDPFDVLYHPERPKKHYQRSMLFGVRLSEED